MGFATSSIYRAVSIKIYCVSRGEWGMTATVTLEPYLVWLTSVYKTGVLDITTLNIYVFIPLAISNFLELTKLLFVISEKSTKSRLAPPHGVRRFCPWGITATVFNRGW